MESRFYTGLAFYCEQEAEELRSRAAWWDFMATLQEKSQEQLDPLTAALSPCRQIARNLCKAAKEADHLAAYYSGLAGGRPGSDHAPFS